MSGYLFRRSDNGEIFEVDFETAMSAVGGAVITTADGVIARRVHRRDPVAPESSQPLRQVGLMQKPIVSDAMGFPQHQFAEMQAHKEHCRVAGVEFVRDPLVPEFYQVHCTSEKAKQDYLKARHMKDYSQVNGSKAMLSPSLLEGAREMVRRRFSTNQEQSNDDDDETNSTT